MAGLMKWRLITDDRVTDSFGLAADEALAQRVGLGESVPTLRLYTYKSHCALVGRFQNVENEVHGQYCKANRIAINRRPTGGGAIIMGADQLGVALTIPGHGKDSLGLTTPGDAYGHARELMSIFSEGLVRGLNELGVRASFRRKNDIEVNGKKLVGLGIYRAPSGGLLFHASLLVDLDIALMLRVLNTPFEKISDKEIETVAGRITTVRRETNSKIDLESVRREIARGFSASLCIELERAQFTSEELQAIDILERDKYLSSEWIYQKSAVADTFGSARLKTPAGLIDVRVTMAGSTIKAAFIGGDFFAAENAVADLEASLRWHTSQPDKIAATLYEAYERRSSEFNRIQPELLIDAVQKAVGRARVAESQLRADPYGCYVNPEGQNA
jgi:lipoate-protein ligase A